MFTNSIRWRLQLWLGFRLVCLLRGFCIALYQLQRSHLWGQVDESIRSRLIGAGGIVLTFGLGGGWWLTARTIRPIEKISAAASRISAGHLS